MTKLVIILASLVAGCCQGPETSAELPLAPRVAATEHAATLICEKAEDGEYRAPKQFSIDVQTGQDVTCAR